MCHAKILTEWKNKNAKKYIICTLLTLQNIVKTVGLIKTSVLIINFVGNK